MLFTAIATLALTYWLTLGGTFNGLLAFPQARYWTLGALGFGALAWFFLRRGKAWHATPLDAVFVLWGVAMGASVLANLETWRRSAEALWYMGLYIVLWYALMDVLTVRHMRHVLRVALLIVGVVSLLFGVWQTLNAFAVGDFGARPVSTIGNPNAFGALLVVLLPFVLLQVGRASGRLARLGLVVYAALALALLALTFSRGAWLGAIVGVAVLGVLALAHHNLLSVGALRAWWRAQRQSVRVGLGVGALITALAVLGAGIVLVQSFSVSGRGADLRTLLWGYAWEMFASQPLTGQGLFTYGYHLPLYWSIPPQQAQSHAHNLPLNVLAEMGLLGALALGATVAVVLLRWRAQWREANAPQRLELMGAYGAAVGFGVHHLFDMPAMMPAVAVIGVFVLTLALAPLQPRPLRARWRVVGHPLGMMALCALLWGVGMWQSTRYEAYFNALTLANEGFRNGTPASVVEGAQTLEALAESDPHQPAYWLQAGYLWGVLADDDPRYLPQALQAYNRFLTLEPHTAMAWANLSALQWQAGDVQAAQISVARAVALAPEWALFARMARIYGGVPAVADVVPTESPFGANMPRYQLLHDVFVNQMIPQTGRAR
jgi:putative inorganic carbon (HCO3(-)) transporter